MPPSLRPATPEPPPAGRPVVRLPIARYAGIGAAVVVMAGALLALLIGNGPSGVLRAPHAILLGAIEGITEFLPISSTGHLVVAERLLGLAHHKSTLQALDSYAVVIQGGAILAVLCLYWRRLIGAFLAIGSTLRLPRFPRSTEPADQRVAVAILVAAAPAGVIGLLFGDTVKNHLFSPGPIALAWAVGGVALLVAARWLHERRVADVHAAGLDFITWQQALIIGVAQALALWPGVSRSLVTIVAGCLVGLTLSAAVEFSFLVGFVVLLAATGLELLKHGGDIISAYGVLNPLIGLVVAFVFAVAAIRWLVAIISGKSLAGFGWYRLGIGVLAFALIAANQL